MEAVMPVCLSPGGTTMYSGASPSRKILVGTVNGVAIVEKDAAGRWAATRTVLDGCHLHALLLDPVSGTIFAGVRNGGVYVSADDAQTWQACNDGLTQNNIYSMCVAHTKDATRIYAGTEPAHLFVTEDMGEKWTELPSLRSIGGLEDWFFPAPPGIAHVKNLGVDNSNPNKIYACVEQGCLLKSDDDGQTWTECYGVDEDAHRIVVHPKHPELLYLATGNGLYRSENGGERWKHITPRTMRIGYPDPLLIHPTQEGLMFMAGALHGPEVWHSTKTANSAIGRSLDGGKTWEILKGGLAEHIHGNIGSMVMEVFDSGFNLFACGTDGDLFYSGDAGETWTTIISELAPLSKGGHHMVLKTKTPAMAAHA